MAKLGGGTRDFTYNIIKQINIIPRFACLHVVVNKMSKQMRSAVVGRRLFKEGKDQKQLE